MEQENKKAIKFARTVESEESFYLLRVDFNEETNNYDLTIETVIDDFDACLKATLSFNNSASALKVMSNIKPENLDKLFPNFSECIEENS